MDLPRSQLPLFLFLLYTSLTTLCLSFPNEFSILDHTPENYISEEQTLKLFKHWREKNDKVYKHEDEMKQRFETFKSNLRFVLEKNMKIKSSSSDSKHVVGLNKFADMSNEEFRDVYLSKVKKPVKSVLELNKNKKKTSTCDAPASLDWRKKGVVTGVKDQGQCGSCWAFSSAGAIEAVNAIVTGNLISLSEQELVDCDTKDEGCNGGFMDTAFEWVISNGGLNTESGYPYTGVDQRCKHDKEQIKVVSIDSYKDISPEESALVCALLTQPISVGIDGGTRDFQLYTKGVYSGECSGNPDDIDHAVLVVGYGSEGDDEYWIAKNSWGTSWGMEGYIYIKRNTSLDYGVCAINSLASYPTKEPVTPSPFPSPSASPPPPPTPKPPPPPPPSPTPSKCGKFRYCQPDTTCCCMFEFYNYCLLYGCCGYENAVCCEGTKYCCPQEYPICDVDEGLCYKSYGDSLGIAAKKRTMAKHKLPWTMFEKAENEYQPLQWRRNPVGVMRR